MSRSTNNTLCAGILKQYETGETATCLLCGEKIDTSDEARTLHLVLAHPMDLLENRKVQKTIFQLAERAGSFLADLLKSGVKK